MGIKEARKQTIIALVLAILMLLAALIFGEVMTMNDVTWPQGQVTLFGVCQTPKLGDLTEGFEGPGCENPNWYILTNGFNPDATANPPASSCDEYLMLSYPQTAWWMNIPYSTNLSIAFDFYSPGGTNWGGTLVYVNQNFYASLTEWDGINTILVVSEPECFGAFSVPVTFNQWHRFEIRANGGTIYARLDTTNTLEIASCERLAVTNYIFFGSMHVAFDKIHIKTNSGTWIYE